MKRHVAAGRLPFWKRCRACLQGRARDRMHRRQAVVETNVLSLDLAGPFGHGSDEDHKKARYALVAVLVIPDLEGLRRLEERCEGDGEVPVPEEGQESPEGLDQDMFGGAIGDDDWLVPEDDDVGDDEDKKAKEVELDGVGEHLLTQLPTKELIFTEILGDKQAPTVLEAIRSVVALVFTQGCFHFVDLAALYLLLSPSHFAHSFCFHIGVAAFDAILFMLLP